jgi:hypothetical protein
MGEGGGTVPRNKHAGKLARRRAYKAGDVGQLRRLVWQACLEAEAVLLSAEDPEVILKACHAVSQCGRQYLRLLEVSEMEQRLAAVEAKLALVGQRNGHARGGFA